MRITKRLAAAAAAVVFCMSTSGCSSSWFGGLLGEDSSETAESISSEAASAEDPSSDDVSEESAAEPAAVTTTTAAEEPSSASESSEAEPEKPSPYEALAKTLPDIELANKTVTRMATFSLDPETDGKKVPAAELFNVKYGGSVKLEKVSYTDRYTKLAEAVTSGKAPDIFPTDDMDSFPVGAVLKLFQPLDMYIDFNDDLWKDSAELNDFFGFNGHHYAAVARALPETVMIYNRRVINERKLDDPAKLFERGEWTWDSFEWLCAQFSDASKDTFALDGYWYAEALSESSGVPLLTLKNGKMVSNLGSDVLAKRQEKMLSLAKENVCFDMSKNNWLPRGNGTGSGVSEGLTLFVPAGLWAISEEESIQNYGSLEKNEIMFVPVPAADDGTQFMPARLEGYHLCTDAPNPEGAAAFLTCCKAAASLTDSEEEQTLRDIGWNEDMLSMRRICCELAETAPVLDCGRGLTPELPDDLCYNIISGTMLDAEHRKAWSQTVEDYSRQLEYLTATINDTEPIGP